MAVEGSQLLCPWQNDESVFELPNFQNWPVQKATSNPFHIIIPRLHTHNMSSQHPKDTKNPKFGHLPLSTSGPEECALTGTALLRSPYHNKGSAFLPSERNEFKLYGHLPPNVQTLEEQVRRAYQQYSSRSDELAKNTFMESMKAQNEVLYYKVCISTSQDVVGASVCSKSASS